MFVRQVMDRLLAQYAYLIGCPRTGEAIVIDPERDVDRYFHLAGQNRLRLVAAVDTHIHADYLSGLREMAERGLLVYASKEGGPDWQYEWLPGSAYQYRLLSDRETFSVGRIEFLALHTPGHTPEHLSYLVRDTGGGAADAIAIASGDFVFVGDVGRPDLLETAAGVAGSMESAARALYMSIQQDFKPLPDFLQVWPAHGAGSACGKTLGDVPVSTVGYERRNNASIHAASEESSFVHFILAGQPEPPLYFARMKRDNRVGPALLPSIPSPAPMAAAALRSLANQFDVAVLDTRRRREFLAGHLPGSILSDLDFHFCTIAGSYVEEGLATCLIVEEERLDEAVCALVRIGLDRIVGYATPATLNAVGLSGGLVQTEAIDMPTLEARRVNGQGRVLDVRSRAEYDEGHVDDAMNIPHTRLLVRLAEIPRDQPVLVHCHSGERAAAAASLLERHGYRAVGVDDLFSHYRPSGAPI